MGAKTGGGTHRAAVTLAAILGIILFGSAFVKIVHLVMAIYRDPGGGIRWMMVALFAAMPLMDMVLGGFLIYGAVNLHRKVPGAPQRLLLACSLFLVLYLVLGVNTLHTLSPEGAVVGIALNLTLMVRYWRELFPLDLKVS
ncbi:MAG: hypothetical protein IPP35_08320 [Elusimicrobia bacterium]|nr:hypothetical protein [Elusimicrobiota bacterium]